MVGEHDNRSGQFLVTSTYLYIAKKADNTVHVHDIVTLELIKTLSTDDKGSVLMMREWGKDKLICSTDSKVSL